MGVTTKKKITPIINGDTIFPKSKPNLNHILFNGVKTLEFINPSIKKIKQIIIDHFFMFPSFWMQNLDFS